MPDPAPSSSAAMVSASPHPPTAAPRTIVHALFARAAANPRGLAYSIEGREATWAGVLEGALRTAALLRAHGVGPGGRVALVFPASLDVVAGLFGAHILGAAPVAINHGAPPPLILRRAERLRCDALLAPAASLPALAAARTALRPALLAGEEAREAPPLPLDAPPPEVDPARIAYLQLTSGTTGEPRAAAITHRSLAAWLRADAIDSRITPRDVLATWVPHYHDLGLVRFYLSPVWNGTTAHIIEASIASLRRWLELATAVRATITASPDFGYRIATRTVKTDGIDLRSLRYATNGGEPVRRRTILDFEAKFGIRDVIRPGYGLAEATLGVASGEPGAPVIADERGNVSCGRPFACFEVRIVDDDGAPLPPGREGEIVVRGEPVFSGYLDDDAATRAVLRDGWLHTGDVGRLDAEGRLFVLGRRRALVKRAGAVLAPREAEEAADVIPGVRLSAAVGLPRGPDGTEDLVLAVEVRDEAATPPARTALAAEVARAVARAVGFAPADIVLLAPRSIPRTANGKIRYDELRRGLAEGTIVRSS